MRGPPACCAHAGASRRQTWDLLTTPIHLTATRWFVDADELLKHLKQFKEGNTPKPITIRDNKTNESIIVMVLTRISARSGNAIDVVFDKVGTEYFLSEIQMPGVDGFVFQGAPDAHTHASIRAKQ